MIVTCNETVYTKINLVIIYNLFFKKGCTMRKENKKVVVSIALGMSSISCISPMSAYAMEEPIEILAEEESHSEVTEVGLNSDIKQKVEEARTEFTEAEDLPDGEISVVGESLQKVEERIDELDATNREAEYAKEDYAEAINTIGEIINDDVKEVEGYSEAIKQAETEVNGDVDAIAGAIAEIELASTKTYSSEQEAEEAKKYAEEKVVIAEQAAANAIKQAELANVAVGKAEEKRKEAEQKVEIAQKAYDNAKRKVEEAQKNLEQVKNEYFLSVNVGNDNYIVPEGDLRRAIEYADMITAEEEQKLLELEEILNDAQEAEEELKRQEELARAKCELLREKRDKVALLADELKKLVSAEEISDEDLSVLKEAYGKIINACESAKNIATKTNEQAEVASKNAIEAREAVKKENGYKVVPTPTPAPAPTPNSGEAREETNSTVNRSSQSSDVTAVNIINDVQVPLSGEVETTSETDKDVQGLKKSGTTGLVEEIETNQETSKNDNSQTVEKTKDKNATVKIGEQKVPKVAKEKKQNGGMMGGVVALIGIFSVVLVSAFLKMKNSIK